jgi:hypothetical protein
MSHKRTITFLRPIIRRITRAFLRPIQVNIWYPNFILFFVPLRPRENKNQEQNPIAIFWNIDSAVHDTLLTASGITWDHDDIHPLTAVSSKSILRERKR